MSILAMFGWGTSELILIGIIAVLLFGRRLPEVGKNLGKSLMEFKHSLKGTADELRDVDDAVDEVNQATEGMRGRQSTPKQTESKTPSGESPS